MSGAPKSVLINLSKVSIQIVLICCFFYHVTWKKIEKIQNVKNDCNSITCARARVRVCVYA